MNSVQSAKTRRRMKGVQRQYEDDAQTLGAKSTTMFILYASIKEGGQMQTRA